MKTIIMLLAILIFPMMGFSATHYVPDDYGTIQEAIDFSVNGDIIVVKPGTYVENINFLGKAITVQSEQGADVTVIDGNRAGSVVTCQSGEETDSVLDGFTITNGHCGGYPGGGGMCNENSSPTVTNCIFSSNSAVFGGGMYNYDDSHPTVTNCTFIENHVMAGGGGMCNENSHPTVTNCLFSDNGAGEPWSDSFGGGMYNYNSYTTVTNCIFSSNSAASGFMNSGQGGGMCNENSSPTITNCTFFGNSTSGWGGGWGGGMCNKNSSTTVTNCTFSANSAGGGGGIGCSPDTSITNSILWDNYPDEINGGPTVSFSDVKGGWPGTGNINADPLFVDPANNDFHLTWLSPCINRGTNDGAPSDDFDGDPRPYMGTVDMGADEFIGVHPLEADTFSVPEAGGTVNFSLKADSGNRKYLIVGGVSGTAPGTSLPGGYETLRVNWDWFSDLEMALLNTYIFSNFASTLDAQGMASAQLNLPSVPGAAGITMHYAYCCNNPFDFVSNPVAVEIVQ